MKVLVAGASGLIGAALIKSLKQKGHSATLLLRPNSSAVQNGKAADSKTADGKATGGKTAGGTKSEGAALFWDPPEKNADLSKSAFDAVVNLCGAPVANKRWSQKRKELLYSSRIDTTRLLAGAAASLDKPPKIFINASAIGIYGTDFLSGLCTDWEAAARPAAEAGINTFALRIGLVVDANARFVKMQKPLFKLGLGGWLGSPKNLVSWVSLEDVAGAICFMLENPESFSGGDDDIETGAIKADSAKTGNADKFHAINMTAPNPATAKEFAKALGKSMRRPAVFRVPKLAPQMLMGKELVNSLLQSVDARPDALLKAGYEFLHPTAEDAFSQTQ